MKKYIQPQIEIVRLTQADLIATSSFTVDFNTDDTDVMFGRGGGDFELVGDSDWEFGE